MTTITTVNGKISPLIRLLLSDKDGEVLGAVLAIRRTLKSAGCDLHDLALVVERAAVPVVLEQPRPEPTPELRPYQAIAMQCLHRGVGRLRDAEADFLRSMATLPSEPSDRQWRWLSAIAMSFNVEMEPA